MSTLFPPSGIEVTFAIVIKTINPQRSPGFQRIVTPLHLSLQTPLIDRAALFFLFDPAGARVDSQRVGVLACNAGHHALSDHGKSRQAIA